MRSFMSLFILKRDRFNLIIKKEMDFELIILIPYNYYNTMITREVIIILC